MQTIEKVISILSKGILARRLVPALVGRRVIFRRYKGDAVQMCALGAVYYEQEGVVCSDEHYELIGDALGLTSEDTLHFQNASTIACYDSLDHAQIRHRLLSVCGLAEPDIDSQEEQGEPGCEEVDSESLFESYNWTLFDGMRYMKGRL